MPLFCALEACRLHSLLLSNILKWSASIYSSLVAKVPNKVVYAMLLLIDSYKALGLDGFHKFYFKRDQEMVGDKVWHLGRDALVAGSIDFNLAEILIVWIPMVDFL